jgi:hypothetical protein
MFVMEALTLENKFWTMYCWKSAGVEILQVYVSSNHSKAKDWLDRLRMLVLNLGNRRDRLLFNQMVRLLCQQMKPSVTYKCLKGMTGYQMTHSCFHLKVVWGSIMGYITLRFKQDRSFLEGSSFGCVGLAVKRESWRSCNWIIFNVINTHKGKGKK